MERRGAQGQVPRRARGVSRVNWYETVFEVIDARSFSSLWFWMSVAVVWSTATNYVVGVPYDLVLRARRTGGEAARDLEAIVGVNVRRLTHIVHEAGLWLVALAAFALTGLGVLALYYRIEYAQAVLLIAGPLTLVGGLTLYTANRIVLDQPMGIDLCRRLTRHRMMVQGIGVLAILMTTMWGMWHNLNASAL